MQTGVGVRGIFFSKAPSLGEEFFDNFFPGRYIDIPPILFQLDFYTASSFSPFHKTMSEIQSLVI